MAKAVDEDARAARIGAVVLAAIALAVGLVLGLQDRHLRSGLTFHIDIAGAGGLVEGSKVRVGGMTIGDVTAVHFGPDGRVIFDLWVEARRGWLVQQNSEIFVNQPGFIGEPYLEIGPHRPRPSAPPDEPGPPAQDGTTLHGVDPPRLDELVRKSFESMNALGATIRTGFPELAILTSQVAKLESTLATIEPTPGAAMTSWQAQKKLFGEGSALLVTLHQTDATPADALRVADHAQVVMAHTRAELATILRRAEKLAPAINRLVDSTHDPRLAALALALDETTAVAAEIDHALATVDEIQDLIARGEGTLGAIMADAELANEFKEMSRTLKRQPWRAVGHPDKGPKPR